MANQVARLTSSPDNDPFFLLFQKLRRKQNHRNTRRRATDSVGDTDGPSPPPPSHTTITSPIATSKPYFMLLQYSCAFDLRHTAVAVPSQADEKVYRRAKLRTPAEHAMRDWSAGSLWLKHIVTQLVRSTSLVAATSTATTSSGKSIGSRSAVQSPSPRVVVLWLQTTPSDGHRPGAQEWLVNSAGGRRLLRDDKNSYDRQNGHMDIENTVDVRILNVSANMSNPFEMKESERQLPSLERLESIVQWIVAEKKHANAASVGNETKIEQSLGDDFTTEPRTSPNVTLVVESLTPLLMRHGFARTLKFLERLLHFKDEISADYPESSSLLSTIILPTRMEMLTIPQHRALEDLAQAVLCVEGGEATMLRQGVREEGKMIRETLEYSVSIDRAGVQNIELVVNNRGDSFKAGPKKTTSGEGPEALTLTEEVDQLSLAQSSSSEFSRHGTRPDGRRQKIQLKMEEDRKPPEKFTTTPLAKGKESQTEANQTPPINAPRIFMQDDDPEFDDYDEEDPDDDLDL